MNSRQPQGRTTGGTKYSVVVPFYNEDECIEELYRRVVTVMDGLGEPYEMVFINDGSADSTQSILERVTRPTAG